MKGRILGLLVGLAGVAAASAGLAQDYRGDPPPYGYDRPYDREPPYGRGYWDHRYPLRYVPRYEFLNHPAYDRYGPDPNGAIAPDGHRIKCKLVESWSDYYGREVKQRACW